MLKRMFCLLLCACLCLCASLGAAEVEEKTCVGIAGPYAWQGYELSVDAVLVGPGGELFSGAMLASRILDKNDSRIMTQITDRMVEIRLLGGPDGIKYEDMAGDEKFTAFVLKDAAGEALQMYCWSWWGVGWDSVKGFGTADTQEGFMLVYYLPDGVNAEDLTLVYEAE